MNKIVNIKDFVVNRWGTIEKHIALLGLLVTGKFIINSLFGIYRSNFRAQAKLDQLYGKGSYALITGGANGIGKAFAVDLAKKGFNLVLMDVNKEALDQVKAELLKIKENLMVKTIEIDFSLLTTPAQYKELFQKHELTSLNISILINNVGIGLGGFGYFKDIPAEMIMKAYIVNTYPAVYMTRFLLGQMSLRNERSLIINMSSSSGLQPLPFFFLYGASKKFLRAMGESLYLEQKEQKKSNIDIMTMTPGYISTQLINYKKGFFIITTEQFVDSVWRQVGRNEHESIGHWRHKLDVNLPSFFFGKRLTSKYWYHATKEEAQNFMTAMKPLLEKYKKEDEQQQFK